MNDENANKPEAPPEPYSPDEHISKIKLEINNLIWTYGPPTMTLGEAEKLASDLCWTMIGAFRK